MANLRGATINSAMVWFYSIVDMVCSAKNTEKWYKAYFVIRLFWIKGRPWIWWYKRYVFLALQSQIQFADEVLVLFCKQKVKKRKLFFLKRQQMACIEALMHNGKLKEMVWTIIIDHAKIHLGFYRALFVTFTSSWGSWLSILKV